MENPCKTVKTSGQTLGRLSFDFGVRKKILTFQLVVLDSFFMYLLRYVGNFEIYYNNFWMLLLSYELFCVRTQCSLALFNKSLENLVKIQMWILYELLTSLSSLLHVSSWYRPGLSDSYKIFDTGYTSLPTMISTG